MVLSNLHYCLSELSLLTFILEILNASKYFQQEIKLSRWSWRHIHIYIILRTFRTSSLASYGLTVHSWSIINLFSKLNYCITIVKCSLFVLLSFCLNLTSCEDGSLFWKNVKLKRKSQGRLCCMLVEYSFYCGNYPSPPYMTWSHMEIVYIRTALWRTDE